MHVKTQKKGKSKYKTFSELLVSMFEQLFGHYLELFSFFSSYDYSAIILHHYLFLITQQDWHEDFPHHSEWRDI